MTAIAAKDISYRYPFCDAPSIDGISFTLGKGEALLVTGASGCGKSTLLRVLNGLAPGHFKGRLDGKLNVLGMEYPAPLGEISAKIGTVLQNPEEQILATTVSEEIALALEWQCVPQEEIVRRVDRALEAFGLSRIATRPVFNLSSGERQKCVLAAVAASGANLVVMDEPTANLSPEATEDLARLCLELKRRGVTLVIADHRLYWLKGVVDKTIVMKDGRIAFETGSPDLLPSHPDFASWGLRRVDVGCGRCGERRGEDSAPYQNLGRAGSPVPAVEIRNLSFRFSRKSEWLYRDFSASIPCGGITAVTGANGAGKTTLARILCGLLKPSSGEIAFPAGGPSFRSDARTDAGGPSFRSAEETDERKLVPPPSATTLSPRQRRRCSAFVMQQMDVQLYMKTVEEELEFSAPPGDDAEARREAAAHWLGVFGLSHLAGRHPHSLSGGEKQRLVVACAMMKRPRLMVLDEPTSGLDGRNMRIIARELKDYAARGGTVLLITHDLELLEAVADFRLEIGVAPPA